MNSIIWTFMDKISIEEIDVMIDECTNKFVSWFCFSVIRDTGAICVQEWFAPGSSFKWDSSYGCPITHRPPGFLTVQIEADIDEESGGYCMIKASVDDPKIFGGCEECCADVSGNGLWLAKKRFHVGGPMNSLGKLVRECQEEVIP